MNRRLDEIVHRKENLIAQCARQRDEISAVFGQIRSPFKFSRVVLGLTHSLKTHPIVAAGLSSLLASGYSGKLLSLAGAGLKLWRLVHPLWLWWRKKR